MKIVKVCAIAVVISLMGLVQSASSTQPSSFQTIYFFHSGADGGLPESDLLAVGSKIYGTTPAYGGSNSGGTAFAVNLDGSNFQTLHTFGQGPYPDGYYSTAGLTLVGQTLFGTTSYGGANGVGTVFSMNLDGSNYQKLYSFAGTNGESKPTTGLAFANSKLYGTTDLSIFSISPGGSGFQTVHTFNGLTEGDRPSTPIAVGQVLYGTLGAGTIYGGLIYSVNLDGSNFQILHGYTSAGVSTEGGDPTGGLTAVGSKLYGTTQYGGPGSNGTIFSMNLDGSNYQVLHSFNRLTDGSQPVARMTLLGSKLYGTAAGPFQQSGGSVFSINLDGLDFDTLHIFSGGTDGENPLGGLATSGSMLFGTTYSGSTGQGTIFAITVPEPSSLLALTIAMAAGLVRRELRRRS
jgi:uncharacterized repeat protein (TIGR03803 family)